MSYSDLLFSFKGRINRLRWWVTAIVVALIVGIAGGVIDLAAQHTGHGTLNAETGQFEPTGLYAVAIGLLYVLNAWISYAITTKRLHDRGRSGWWLVVQIVGIVIAVAALMLGLARPEHHHTIAYVVAGVFGVASAIIGLWIFIEVGFLKGTNGPNSYGPDPLAPPFSSGAGL
jgi:uncharacterized membrane protein YhaH (DUF805 family)